MSRITQTAIRQREFRSYLLNQEAQMKSQASSIALIAAALEVNLPPPLILPPPGTPASRGRVRSPTAALAHEF